jgi:hypothetical protein
LKKQKTKYYNSCEFLPLWNFFKLNNGKTQNLKYLLVLNNRLDYDGVELNEVEAVEANKVWIKIFAEYNGLEKNYASANFLSDKTRIIYFYNLYINEQAMIRSLLYKTNVEYIRKLRETGYDLSNKSQDDYGKSLFTALNRVENHITYIKILKNKIKDVEGESKKEGNPYDEIMAWILSNEIKVDDNLTVTRYIKVKEIILNRIKAKQRDNTKSRMHGRRD